MAKKRIRIDMEDADGAKYDIKLEGNVTREKVLKIFEMMDLMNIEQGPETPNLNSIGGKIWNIIDKHFPVGKFTSNEILEKYEDEYEEPIKLSVISTYLSRFSSKGKIERSKKGREWAYQTIKLSQKHNQPRK
ncbi:MAG: hypothetical protein NPMRTH5_110009 [Nitrosopumilales archaeon]|nr:MAG: hypothetical protein NPMRTH5_110009 [Nitrosopumilales archaeon]KAG2478073.1 MAG: hypothetical protein NPMRTH1_780030 [Nitrosopumilales archaeon]